MRVTDDMRAARNWMIAGELWALALEAAVLVFFVLWARDLGPAFFIAALALAIIRGAYRLGVAAAYIWRLVWPRLPTPRRQPERCLWPPRRHDGR